MLASRADGGNDGRPALVEPAQHRWAKARVLPRVVLGAALDQPGPAQITREGPRSPRGRDPLVVRGEDELRVEALGRTEQRAQRVGAAGPALEGTVVERVEFGPGRPSGEVAAARRGGGQPGGG